MPNRVYVHIGLPKTATTMLQMDYFPYVDSNKYMYLGVFQPRDTESDELYYDLCCAINSGSNIFEVNAKIKKKLRDDSGSLIFSEEMFTVSQSEISWQKKISNLAKVFEGIDFRILITIREPVSAMFSFYVESYYRYMDSNESFSDLAINSNDFKIYHYDYILKILERKFTRERIYIQKFEDLIIGDFSIVNRFLSFNGAGVNFISMNNRNQKRKTSTAILIPKNLKFKRADRLYQAVGGDRNVCAFIVKRTMERQLKRLLMLPCFAITVQKPSDLEYRELMKIMRGSMEYMFKHYGIRY